MSKTFDDSVIRVGRPGGSGSKYNDSAARPAKGEPFDNAVDPPQKDVKQSNSPDNSAKN